MSKLNASQQTSEQKKTATVGIVAVLLAAVNFVPLHHFSRQNCAGGGTFTTSGTTLGLPMAYYETWHGSPNDCGGYASGDGASKSFSAQGLLGDGLVVGLVMMGANVLLDRRTNK